MTNVTAAARSVLQAARARDRAEIEAVVGYDFALGRFLEPWLDGALIVRVFEHEKTPAAFVAVHAVNARTVAMSMIATDAWRHVARAVAKWAKREAMPLLLGLGYVRAECRAIDGHEDGQVFLEWLGFHLECRCPQFGHNGETFLQYAWRSNDHVLCP